MPSERFFRRIFREGRDALEKTAFQAGILFARRHGGIGRARRAAVVRHLLNNADDSVRQQGEAG
ncbi:TPA: hypothetical protein ACLA9Y_001762 [Neisseria meningitidis]